jgi:hypothetical protein
LKRKLQFGLVTTLFLSGLFLPASSAHAQRSPSSVSSSTSTHLGSSKSGVALIRSGGPTHQSAVLPAVSQSAPLRTDRRQFAGNAHLGISALFGSPSRLRPPAPNRPPKNTRVSPSYFLFLDGGGAYYLPETADQAPQEQVAAEQSPEQLPEVAEAQPFTPESEGSAPLPDEGEFTLVLHNGTQIEAVAFTHVKDKIVYITPQGGRRTIAVAEIDSNATERVNQDRGTPIQLPL